MAGRGRGRGRGGTSSFSREQLNSMGFSASEALPAVVTAPPPLFPPLERKPVHLTSTPETNYMLILKQDFLENMRYNSSCVDLPTNQDREPEQEIDKLLAQLPKLQQSNIFDWNLLPKELRSKVSAKRKQKSDKEIDVSSRLTELEKLEKQKQTVANDAPNDAKKVKTETNELEQEFEEEILEEDEEMDEGTDYANNYFDNGEDYEEDDDTLDDGPIF